MTIDTTPWALSNRYSNLYQHHLHGISHYYDHFPQCQYHSTITTNIATNYTTTITSVTITSTAITFTMENTTIAITLTPITSTTITYTPLSPELLSPLTLPFP